MGEVRRVGLIICLFCVLLSVDRVVDIGEIGFEIEVLMVCSASLIGGRGRVGIKQFFLLIYF